MNATVQTSETTTGSEATTEEAIALRVIRIRAVEKKMGLSRATISRREREGSFPSRRRLGTNSVGWIEAEVDEWISKLARKDGES